MVGLIDESFKKFPINSRIKILEEYGTVRYAGAVQSHPGTWVGIEWDNPTRGKHDGITNGIRYFQTAHPTAGSMIRLEKIPKFQTLEDAIKERYIENEASRTLDEELLRETQSQLHASLIEVVGMEKIANRQSRVDELEDISVTNSLVNSAGDLTVLKSLTSLNLSATLIWNWRSVADITRQIPTLVYLNLSSNRLELPTEACIREIEPHFRNITHINLRKCGLRSWKDVLVTAQLWPDVTNLSLQENEIESIIPADCTKVFRNLRELYLSMNKLSDFTEICKLGNIKTLTSLYLMDNSIASIRLPDCDYDKKLSIFSALKLLNLNYNPLDDDCNNFNELDKLVALETLCKTPSKLDGFEEMFSTAVALISQLKKLNKAEITSKERRGAEYDIWKKYANEWQRTENDPTARSEFCKTCRNYKNFVKKYGSPADFSTDSKKKISTLVKIRVLNKLTGENFEKKVPRQMSLQTLQGLIIKRFQISLDMPKLSYMDAQHPTLVVPLENLSKNLDYYSIQDGDTVTVE